MNLFRHRLVRLPVIAIGVAAWLAVSNHCAIAAVQGAARMPMPTCHGGAAEHAPAKHDHESGVDCCKVLRATLLTFSTNLTACDTLTFAVHDYVVALISAADESRPNCIIELDTGPPAAESFAESVLQRSILTHAPPFRA